MELPEAIQATKLVLELQKDNVPQAIGLEGRLVSQGNGRVAVQVTAAAERAVPNALYTARAVVRAGDETVPPLEIPVEVTTHLVPPTWPYWLAGILVLAALIGGFLAYRSVVAKRRLFGQLEAWPQGDPRQVQRVDDLSSFGAKASLGADQILLPGAGGTIGTLTTRTVDDERHVCAHPGPGQRLTMDGRTYDELPLFHGDTFEIGGWVFRYRGGSRRR